MDNREILNKIQVLVQTNLPNKSEKEKNQLIDLLYEKRITFWNDVIQLGIPDAIFWESDKLQKHYGGRYPKEIIELVFKWVYKMSSPDFAIHYLHYADDRYDGSKIIPYIFENCSLPQCKWTLCDAIEQNPPLNIEKWVVDTYCDSRYGYEVGLLALLIVKLFKKDKSKSIEILKLGFDYRPEFATQALIKIGERKELEYIRQKISIQKDERIRGLMIKDANKLEKRLIKKGK